MQILKQVFRLFQNLHLRKKNEVETLFKFRQLMEHATCAFW